MPQVPDLSTQPRFTAKDVVMLAWAGICLTFGLAYIPVIRLVHINPPAIAHLNLTGALWAYGVMWLVAGLVLIGASLANRRRGTALGICAAAFFAWGGLFGISAVTGLPTAWIGTFLYFLIGIGVAGTSRLAPIPKVERESVERVSGD